MVVRGKAQLRPDDQAIFLIANTGEEDERALIFADRCDRHYGLNLVWVEAVIDPRPRAVTTHRVVTFETATRGPALFEAMCAKYGLPGPGFLHCTRELKTRAMDSYLRSIGWARGTYTTCIGIRADEMDRIDPDFRRKRYAYPLASAGVRKPDVHAAWDARPFQLGMREHEGNCRWCWKKSLRKHLTLAVENPAVFETPRLLERTYPEAGAGDQVRRLFRQRRTTDDLFALAAQPFEPFVDQRGKGQVDLLAPTFDAELDLGGSCGESCEAFGDERSPSLEAAE